MDCATQSGEPDQCRFRRDYNSPRRCYSGNAPTPAKAAIASWSRALSIQVAADGITVNCVAPGRINSEQVLKHLFPTEEIRRREIELDVPAGRFGDPEEIAAMITFLASERASYVNGTMIPVDGGFLRLDLK